MQLTNDQLTEFSAGVSRDDNTHPCWKPMRIPEVMQAIYGAPDGRSARMACTAGVRIRFVSDTGRIRIRMGFGRRARHRTVSCLLVDGQLANCFSDDGSATVFEGVIFDQDAGTRRLFDLWLPHMCESWVELLEVDDNAVVEPAPALAAKWLVYGDSISQGMTAVRPIDTYVARCALELNLDAHNFAVGGATCDPELAQTVPDDECQVISIAYGTNDIARGSTLSEFASATADLLDVLMSSHPRVPIILISPPVILEGRESDAFGSTMEHYREVLKSLADKRESVTYVHGLDLVEADANLFVDKVHPNADGFEQYANTLLPVLCEVLVAQPG